MPDNAMHKKCHVEHKTYAQECGRQKVPYRAQNVRLRVRCAKSAIRAQRECDVQNLLFQAKIYTQECDT